MKMKGCNEASISNEGSIKQKNECSKLYILRLGRSFFYSELRLGYVLKMFLFFWQFEPQRSIKHGTMF